MLRNNSAAALAAAAIVIASVQVAGATGLATCDSGPQDGW